VRRRPTGAQRADARDRTLGFVLLAVALHERHRLALAELAPQLLGKELGVGRDHVVGRAQDGARGAVVLLERDDLEPRVVLRQALEVVQRRAAPAVDALVIVAHGGEDAVAPHQRLEQLVLHGVGVLHLVHQHVGKGLLPLRARLLVARQQRQGQPDQVVEVHRLKGQQPLGVALHHARG
jgi:hypothetical protein